jgi:'Cold-shock' DNA-binding domain
VTRADRSAHTEEGTQVATGTVKWFNDDKGFGFAGAARGRAFGLSEWDS